MSITTAGYVLPDIIYETLTMENLDQADEILRFVRQILDPLRRLSTGRFAFTDLENVEDAKDRALCEVRFRINGAPGVFDLNATIYPSGMADRDVMEIFLTAVNAALIQHQIPDAVGIVEGEPLRGFIRSTLRLVLVPRQVAIDLANDPASPWRFPRSAADLAPSPVGQNPSMPGLPTWDELVPPGRVCETELDVENDEAFAGLFADLLELLGPNGGIVVASCATNADDHCVVRLDAGGKEVRASFAFGRFTCFEITDLLNASLDAIGSEERFCIRKINDEVVCFAVVGPEARLRLEREDLLETPLRQRAAGAR
jgi:hypothetical protein